MSGVSLPLIESSDHVVNLLLMCIVFFLILCLSTLFFIGFGMPGTALSVFVSGGVGMIACMIGLAISVSVSESSVGSARQEAFEEELGATIIDGSLITEETILLEKDGEIKRMSFNINKDLGVMTLTHIG